MWWLYTTLENAQAAIAILNYNIQQFNPNITYIDEPSELTAEPEIGGITYFYGFSKPPENIQEGAEYDLETEYSTDWFLPEEP